MKEWLASNTHNDKEISSKYINLGDGILKQLHKVYHTVSNNNKKRTKSR